MQVRGKEQRERGQHQWAPPRTGLDAKAPPGWSRGCGVGAGRPSAGSQAGSLSARRLQRSQVRKRAVREREGTSRLRRDRQSCLLVTCSASTPTHCWHATTTSGLSTTASHTEHCILLTARCYHEPLAPHSSGLSNPHFSHTRNLVLTPGADGSDAHATAAPGLWPSAGRELRRRQPSRTCARGRAAFCVRHAVTSRARGRCCGCGGRGVTKPCGGTLPCRGCDST